MICLEGWVLESLIICDVDMKARSSRGGLRDLSSRVWGKAIT